MHINSGAPHSGTWDPRYERKAVTLLAVGSGLVGLDRFIINPLFPVIQKELGLNYQDLGLISAVLALTWGIASIFSGKLSDRVGRKKVLVPAVVIFSLLVASSGLAAGLLSLLLIRSLMGFAEGAYVPASIVATVEASKPTRIGLNVGIQQMTASMVGLGLGPLIAVGLLSILPSWHWVFGVVAVPGLVLAFLMARILRTDHGVRQVPDEASPSTRWRDVLSHRAVLINTLSMVLYLSSMVTLSAFMPNYLTDRLGFSMEQMGLVLASLGVGGCIGMVVVPALSDRLGAKRVLIVALLVELVALWAMLNAGTHPGQVFAYLFVIAFLNTGVLGLTVGPLTAAAVPPHLATSATGVVVGVGEILGGALAPAVAGTMAHQMGIGVIPYIALVAIGLALVTAVLGVRNARKSPRLQHA